ncbi:MAG: preprotein translocase subunit SecG [Deltaproteobacteria bacterium]|jgi:preprotein translocase subunit SecG|nr:preprotein translocase subunit SecG [Deltaproteobacteria bacterium]
MYSAITLIHILVAIILIISVLLQAGKNSGMGAAFGGSSGSVFGSRGPATIISRVTSVSAIIFMATSMSLSLSSRVGMGEKSVLDSVVTEESGSPAPVEATSPPNLPAPVPPTPVSTSESPAGDPANPSQPQPVVESSSLELSATGSNSSEATTAETNSSEPATPESVATPQSPATPEEAASPAPDGEEPTEN